MNIDNPIRQNNQSFFNRNHRDVITISFSLIALVFSFVTTGFVCYNNFFLERAMIGIKNFKVTLEGDKIFFNYEIFNSGKSKVTDTEFKVYVISIDDDQNKGEILWRDSIPNVIFPDTSFSFGRHYMEETKYGLSESQIELYKKEGKYEKLALIFDITYNEGIWGEINSSFYFIYCFPDLGDDEDNVVKYLLKSDLDKIKNRYEVLKNING